MEEDDTYRVFVNDDPISTRKALNSRLDKLSGQHTPPKERSSATISSGVREQHDFVTANFPQKAQESKMAPQSAYKDDNIGRLRLSVAESEA